MKTVLGVPLLWICATVRTNTIRRKLDHFGRTTTLGQKSKDKADVRGSRTEAWITRSDFAQKGSSREFEDVYQTSIR
jgi:hypothetical protein